jgi:hypothetical protein
MSFQVSPGINVREFDFSTSVPQSAVTPAALVGDFGWGPVNEATTVSTVDELKLVFSKPNEFNYKPFFTASNFLNYAQSLRVVRSVSEFSMNAISGTVSTRSDILAKYSTLPTTESTFVNRSNSVPQSAKDWQTGGTFPLGILSVGTATSSGSDESLTTTTSSNIFMSANTHIPNDWTGNYTGAATDTNLGWTSIEDMIDLKLVVGSQTISIPTNHRNYEWIHSGNPDETSTNFTFGKDITFGISPLEISPAFVLDTSVVAFDELFGLNHATLDLAWTTLKGLVGDSMAAYVSQSYVEFLQSSVNHHFTTAAARLALFENGYNILASASNFLVIRGVGDDDGSGDFRIPLSVTTDSTTLVSVFDFDFGSSVLDSGGVDVGKDEFAALIGFHSSNSFVNTMSQSMSFDASNTIDGITIELSPRNTFRLYNEFNRNGQSISFFLGSTVSTDQISGTTGQLLVEGVDYRITPISGSTYSNLYLGFDNTGADNWISQFAVTEKLSMLVEGVPYSFVDSEAIQILDGDAAISYAVNNTDRKGVFSARYPGAYGNRLKVTMLDSSTHGLSPLSNSLSVLPLDDNSLSVIVELFEDEKQNKVENYEVFDNLTKSQVEPGTENRNWMDYINQNSSYVFALQVPDGYKEPTAGTNVSIWKNDLLTVDGYTQEVYMGLDISNTSYILSGGTSATPTKSELIESFDAISNKEKIDISLILSGGYHLGINDYTDVIRHSIELSNIREDCVTIFSAPEDVYKNKNISNITEWFDSIGISTSYAFADSNYKRQYDVYNDKYRWLPFCGDVAGVFARTDTEHDPWFSPAGFNRGSIKNVVKLYTEFTKDDRDKLYLKSINPIVSFPGQGTILYGDKTFLARPSAFDRINVRKLFIVLEKIISNASTYTLFEFNDTFTRGQFVSMVEPFLSTVKSRQGVHDYTIICDETNNPPNVVDAGQFVGDIYIKPTRSINYIRLNFVAVRSGVEFSEVVGNR